MLPYCAFDRIQRDSNLNKPSGRSQEIQRLIGRVLRSILDLKSLPEGQILIDCDVLNADGRTRTAAITGGYVALVLLIKHLMKSRTIHKNPIKEQIAAITCGVIDDEILVDLDYLEDSRVQMDANIILSKSNKIIELQVSGENGSMSNDELNNMLKLTSEALVQVFQ